MPCSLGFVKKLDVKPKECTVFGDRFCCERIRVFCIETGIPRYAVFHFSQVLGQACNLWNIVGEMVKPQ
jgi:hypothetical protein